MAMKRCQLSIHSENSSQNSLSLDQAKLLQEAIQRGDRALVNIFIKAIKNDTLRKINKDFAKK